MAVVVALENFADQSLPPDREATGAAEL
jgi:hypothetical protein